ncbi:hypothetical protein ACJRO7_009989 [Eucalyptus globulus]|uniref:Dipeptide epimerase n=1 Tax=Eucalyptus globulus TaxID=34317 RepID=A0ABD3LAJ1_EUCGL
METFVVEVRRAESRALDVPLAAPFTIATSRLERVSDVAVRVELRNGCAVWGEAPVLPSVTAEDQGTAIKKAREACQALRRSPAMGVEMALIDAVANSIGAPLWKLSGGASNTLTTDITIPIVSPAEAAELALKCRKQGFQTSKLKVSKDLKADIKVHQAIWALHPTFHRDDWEGLGHDSRIAMGKYGISTIVNGNLANAINIKLTKLGVFGALDIIEFAREYGLDLMIGGMVETRLAMGFAGHLATGFGCFKFIDLDTPLLLAEDPVFGVSGANYRFSNARSHGGFLHWDNIVW